MSTCARDNAAMGRAVSLMPAMQIKKQMANARYKMVTAKKGTTNNILQEK